MKDENIMSYADTISRFCRLQMNVKRDLPIRSSEMGALIFIQKSETAVTPLMISSFFGIAKPSVTDMLTSLIKKEYINKIQSTEDRRSYTVQITDKGNELVESTFEQYVKSLKLLEEKMGQQQFDLFMQLLKKANKILSEERYE